MLREQGLRVTNKAALKAYISSEEEKSADQHLSAREVDLWATALTRRLSDARKARSEKP